MSGFQTNNPDTGEVLQEWSYASFGEIEACLEGLAAGPLRELSILEKKERLLRFSEGLAQAKESLAQCMALEMGKPVHDGRAEIEKSILSLNETRDSLEFLLEPRVGSLNQKLSYRIERRPLGVILAIMPWNFPIWQVMRLLPMAFVAGNSVLLKHSELTSGTAELFAEIAQESLGLEFFSSLRLSHEQVESVISDSRIRLVTMTGSARGGAAVAGHCGMALKKCILELGGSDPVLVFKNSNLAEAAKAAATSRMINNGQSCISAKRMIVEESVYPQFLDFFLDEMGKFQFGSPRLNETRLGPLAHGKFVNDLKSNIEVLKSQGGKLLTCSLQKPQGTQVKGAYFPWQVFKADGFEKVLFDQEFFGPVAVLSTFKSLDEAIKKANHSRYGLGAAIFLDDENLFQEVGRQIQCGILAWNDFVRSYPGVPFGGIKDSGFGRELGVESFGEIVNTKSLIGPFRV